MTSGIKDFETVLFYVSLLVLIGHLVLAFYNHMEGWEITIIIPLIYCIIKLKRISNDNEKIKEALKIEDGKKKSKEN